MIQFVIIALLNFVGAVINIVVECHDASSGYECASSAAIDMVYVILLAGWFGFIWVLAYAAQQRRDHRLAAILMGAEAMVLVVSLFNAKHYPNLLGLITSLVDAAFAVWIIFLAFRLIRAKGGRIRTSTSSRPRRRPGSTQPE